MKNLLTRQVFLFVAIMLSRNLQYGTIDALRAQQPY